MNAKQIFKKMYSMARKDRYVAECVALANNVEPDHPQAYFAAERVADRLIWDHDLDYKKVLPISRGVLWAINWRFPHPEDAQPDKPKWLSQRHLCFVMSSKKEESRVWFEHPGIPGVTREMSS